MPTYTIITAGSSNNTWSNWSTENDTSISNGTRAGWNATVTGITITSNVFRQPEPAPVQTPAQRAEATRREQDRQREYRRQERERAAAKLRASKLLMSTLTAEQLTEYKRANEFKLYTNGRCYLVRQGRAGNVFLLDEQGNRVRKYCAHPIDSVPDEDTMLAQKLLLETDEQAFLQMANASAA